MKDPLSIFKKTHFYYVKCLQIYRYCFVFKSQFYYSAIGSNKERQNYQLSQNQIYRDLKSF